VTHGFQSVFSRYLNEQGIAAAEVKTEFGSEEETEEQVPPSTGEEMTINHEPTFNTYRRYFSRRRYEQLCPTGAGAGNFHQTNDKLDALVNYFSGGDDKDKVWVIAWFSGRRPRRTVSGTQLTAWCSELINLPAWLFAECYLTVGDLSETIALLIPEVTAEPATKAHRSLHYYVEKFLQLEKASEQDKKAFIIQSWLELTGKERFVFNKLLSSTFRVGVSQKMMVECAGKDGSPGANIIAHRIKRKLGPVHHTFDELLSEQSTTADLSNPIPFTWPMRWKKTWLALGSPENGRRNGNGMASRTDHKKGRQIFRVEPR